MRPLLAAGICCRAQFSRKLETSMQKEATVAKNIQIDGSALTTGLEVVQEISEFQPFSSISFLATEIILDAVEETSKLVNWGMAKNKHKMKAAALEIMEHIAEAEPGEPVNLNLDEYQLESMAAAADLIERALGEKKDGVALTNLPDD